ncbi:D-alanine--D-alanine ligase [Patescibacteria group bacterium]|nr:D-alanine--D-alanine ligase [Patescibacteria group bacterium]MBU4142527.1 D-alanine--D-alanine ligase [Patescibacteria group bacterium]
MKKLRIALLCGGFSAEREISFKTGKKILENLDKKKYQVFLFDPKTELGKFIKAVNDKKIDLVFPALHGPLGEDGTIQGLLEIFNLPYVFSGVLASSLAMDKERTKKILLTEKILMPRAMVIEKNYQKDALNKIKGIKNPVFCLRSDDMFRWRNASSSLAKIRLPVVIKPICQGSSFGVFIVKKRKDLAKSIKEAFKFGPELMAEEFIRGREITAAVLGNKKPQALPLIEIRPKTAEFFDFQSKYEPGASDEICPAPIDEKLTKKIQEQALRIHCLFGCRGVTRSDFIIKNGQPYFLEINTIPGMTETSLVPLATTKAGLSFSELLDKLIELALEK